ncbi:unnamed protein product [Darwinula stevensoni]|uniref:SAC3/GANP/THP3 conserved domain-containing protein n=1 Tax=Darwinula stevensoni TaxID=69355 RepID=A0A7R9FNX0_9CRUS|nr:unnamed protein product [Darwinula stevensoni]CAG0897292.1 unnamed protein product [Darwinula stevensoni]
MSEGSIQGTCRTFCPARESDRRRKHREVHALEKDPETGDVILIKEYTRSGAGRDMTAPAELRPGPVLSDCVVHLIQRVSSRTDARFLDVYDFICDRLRAVRQDLVIQRLSGVHVQRVLASSLRFLLMAGYRLRKEDGFQEVLHANQVRETLSCYLERVEIKRNCHLEVLAVGLVLDLDEELPWIRFLAMRGSRPEEEEEELVGSLVSLKSAWLMENLPRMLRIAGRLPLLLQLAFGSLLPALRRKALETLNAGFSSRGAGVPLPPLTAALALRDDGETARLLAHHGIPVRQNCAAFRKSVFVHKPPLPLGTLPQVEAAWAEKDWPGWILSK